LVSTWSMERNDILPACPGVEHQPDKVYELLTEVLLTVCPGVILYLLIQIFWRIAFGKFNSTSVHGIKHANS